MQLSFFLLLAVAACGLADARDLQQTSPGAGQTAESALGVELVDMLLGEWLLGDTTVRVPGPVNGAGIASMAGNTVNTQVAALSNNTRLADMDNLQLSEELQQLVVAIDGPKTNSSTESLYSFVVVSSNSVTGATVAYYVWRVGAGRPRQTRLLGFARRTADSTDTSPKVTFVGGEQVSPAQWTLDFGMAGSGEMQLYALRLQPYQVNGPDPRNASRQVLVERQSLSTMGPCMKTNATLATLLPEIAARF
ncbi:hypothetical protein N2152v2_003571 [Parachlorella kessleri]